MSLKGKTLFITGASRGIGLAIGTRAARDGANIAIAAKSDQPHPKLPGTIHTAAREVEEAGGKALRDAGRHSRRERGRAGRETVRGAFRRHRHRREQRQRHLAVGHARNADEALRPDVRRQRARHVRDFAGVPAVSQAVGEGGTQPAHIEPVAAAEHEGEVVRAARRVHDGEVRHEHVRARHGGGISSRRHRA